MGTRPVKQVAVVGTRGEAQLGTSMTVQDHQHLILEGGRAV